MTHLHISVPAITRGTLTRTHELKNKKIALFKKYFILQGKFHFSLRNEQRVVLNCVSLGHNLLVKVVFQNEILCKCMFNEKQCNLLIFLFTAATVIAIFFSTSYIKNHRRRLFQKKSRHQPSATCHYIADTRCLTSATLECYVRRETSVTVPSRLNAPIVL